MRRKYLCIIRTLTVILFMLIFLILLALKFFCLFFCFFFVFFVFLFFCFFVFCFFVFLFFCFLFLFFVLFFFIFVWFVMWRNEFGSVWWNWDWIVSWVMKNGIGKEREGREKEILLVRREISEMRGRERGERERCVCDVGIEKERLVVFIIVVGFVGIVGGFLIVVYFVFTLSFSSSFKKNKFSLLFSHLWLKKKKKEKKTKREKKRDRFIHQISSWR